MTFILESRLTGAPVWYIGRSETGTYEMTGARGDAHLFSTRRLAEAVSGRFSSAHALTVREIPDAS